MITIVVIIRKTTKTNAFQPVIGNVIVVTTETETGIVSAATHADMTIEIVDIVVRIMTTTDVAAMDRRIKIAFVIHDVAIHAGLF